MSRFVWCSPRVGNFSTKYLLLSSFFMNLFLSCLWCTWWWILINSERNFFDAKISIRIKNLISWTFKLFPKVATLIFQPQLKLESRNRKWRLNSFPVHVSESMQELSVFLARSKNKQKLFLPLHFHPRHEEKKWQDGEEKLNFSPKSARHKIPSTHFYTKIFYAPRGFSL